MDTSWALLLLMDLKAKVLRCGWYKSWWLSTYVPWKTGIEDRWLYQSLPVYRTASTAMSTRTRRWVTKNVSESTTPLQTTPHPQFEFNNLFFVTIRNTKLRKNRQSRRRLSSKSRKSSRTTARPGVSLAFDKWGEISMHIVYAGVHAFQPGGSFLFFFVLKAHPYFDF